MKEVYFFKDRENYVQGLVFLERGKSITRYTWEMTGAHSTEFGEFEGKQIDTPENNESFKEYQKSILDPKAAPHIWYNRLDTRREWEYDLVKVIFRKGWPQG